MQQLWNIFEDSKSSMSQSFSRLNSHILSCFSLQDHFSQTSDHSCCHSLDSFNLSMFFSTSLTKTSTPVQNMFLLWKATFPFIIVRCLPLEECHETVDSHSVCKPLNPLLHIWHLASYFSVCSCASDYSCQVQCFVFLRLIELTTISSVVTKGDKGPQFILTVFKYHPLNLELVRPALRFHGWAPLLWSYRRRTLSSTFHQ